MKTVGFIGAGVMGKSMIRNLMKAGFSVSVYTRTKNKADDIISEGAVWCGSVASCCADKDAVITIVGFPKDVEEVYFGNGGIIGNVKTGTYIIDMTTSDPGLAKCIYDAAKNRGVFALDAPVSGGDAGAKNGTLAIMAGGDKADFDTCLPLFNAMGKTIVYEGPAGSGQHTKMANQIAICGAVSGVCEALSYAKNAGLDVKTVWETISQGAAGSWQMSNMAPRMLGGDYSPGFYIKHFIKDIRIALNGADENGLDLGITKKVLSMYEVLEKDGAGDLGTQALIKYYGGIEKI